MWQLRSPLTITDLVPKESVSLVPRVVREQVNKLPPLSGQYLELSPSRLLPLFERYDFGDAQAG